jgi:hypothetical protein
VIAGQLKVFSTFEAVSHAHLLDTEGEAQARRPTRSRKRGMR